MLKPILTAAIIVAAIPAKADLLQADIYGVAAGTPYTQFSNVPYHFTAVFDTTLGTMKEYSPGHFILGSQGWCTPGGPMVCPLDPLPTTNPLVSDGLILEGLGTVTFVGRSLMEWQVDDQGNLSDPWVQLGELYTHYSGHFYQYGTCPRSCSELTITASTLTNLSAAPLHSPGPIAGAGLPGLLLLTLLLMYRRAIQWMTPRSA